MTRFCYKFTAPVYVSQPNRWHFGHKGSWPGRQFYKRNRHTACRSNIHCQTGIQSLGIQFYRRWDFPDIPFYRCKQVDALERGIPRFFHIRRDRRMRSGIPLDRRCFVGTVKFRHTRSQIDSEAPEHRCCSGRIGSPGNCYCRGR